MKVISFILLCSLPIINCKPIKNNIPSLKDNCLIKHSKYKQDNNISCISCELGVSIIKYEYDIDNLNKTVNIMKNICNSTILNQYQNLNQECNIIFNNIPQIIKQFEVNHTVNQVCSKLLLC